MHSSIAHLAVVLSAVAPLAACTAPAPATNDGVIQIPLQQAGPDGVIYHLSAMFQIDGPAGTQVVDGTGFDPSVTVALPPGIVEVTLLDGWTLEKSVGTAAFQPVSAVLGSPNPSAARVLANQPFTLSFEFLVRDTSGQLTISFGVDPAPRELAGGMIIESGTADLASYANVNSTDFAVFYDLAGVDSATLADGTKDRTFTAGPVAMEVYNDPFVLLSGTVAPAVAGGFLAYHLAAHPDGTQSITGEIDGFEAPFPTLIFGPLTLTTNLPLDADGFVTDAFVFESFVPFTLSTTFPDGAAELTGTLRFRSIPQTPAP